MVSPIPSAIRWVTPWAVLIKLSDGLIDRGYGAELANMDGPQPDFILIGGLILLLIMSKHSTTTFFVANNIYIIGYKNVGAN